MPHHFHTLQVPFLAQPKLAAAESPPRTVSSVSDDGEDLLVGQL